IALGWASWRCSCSPYSFSPVCTCSCCRMPPSGAAGDAPTKRASHALNIIPIHPVLSMKTMSNVTLLKKQREELLRTLKARFEKNMNRHKGLEWAKVQAKLEANAE